MPTQVSIRQNFFTNDEVFNLFSQSNKSILRMLVNGAASGTPSATQATIAITESGMSGWTISATGTGLTYDAGNHLTGGTLGALVLRNASGTAVGWLNAGAVPLGLDLADYRAGMNTPALLNAMFPGWEVTFTGTGMPASPFVFYKGALLEGLPGDDVLNGGVNTDVLRGGWGDDTIRGYGGVDVLDGDTPSYVAPGTTPTGNDLLYGGDGDDYLRGRNGHDTLYGDAGNDTLLGDQIGETGRDSILGGAGNDQLWGGAGNDTLNGGTGYDRIVQQLPQSGSMVFTIDLTQGTMTGEGTDTLIGIEGATGATYQKNVLIGNALANGLTGGNLADSITGNDGTDRLMGGAANDTLRGGTGSDTICGGSGLDLLTGGAGADSFYFASPATGDTDRISDFAHGVDEILLNIPGLGLSGPLAASAFKVIGSGAIDASDRVIYDRATGSVYVDVDGSGAAARLLICRVTAGTLLSAGDFTHVTAGQIVDFT